VEASKGRCGGYYSYSYMTLCNNNKSGGDLDRRRKDDFRYNLIQRKMRNAYWAGRLYMNEFGSHLSLDCEWARGLTQNVLGRVSLVNENLDIVYTTYVQPVEEIVDYNTHISGLTFDRMKDGQHFYDVRNDIMCLIRGKCVVGYCLSGDFKVLDIKHENVIDFYEIGFPKLSYMVLFYFQRVIQEAEHSSTEDALAVMEIFLYLRDYFTVRKNMYVIDNDYKSYDVLKYLFSRRKKTRIRFERFVCDEHVKGVCYKFYPIPELRAIVDPVYRCLDDYDSRQDMIASVFAEVVSLYLKEGVLYRYSKERVDIISDFYMSYMGLGSRVKLPFNFLGQRLGSKELSDVPGSAELQILLNSST